MVQVSATTNPSSKSSMANFSTKGEENIRVVRDPRKLCDVVAVNKINLSFYLCYSISAILSLPFYLCHSISAITSTSGNKNNQEQERSVGHFLGFRPSERFFRRFARHSAMVSL